MKGIIVEKTGPITIEAISKDHIAQRLALWKELPSNLPIHDSNDSKENVPCYRRIYVIFEL